MPALALGTCQPEPRFGDRIPGYVRDLIRLVRSAGVVIGPRRVYFTERTANTRIVITMSGMAWGIPVVHPSFPPLPRGEVFYLITVNHIVIGEQRRLAVSE
jgi:hypothetical protein